MQTSNESDFFFGGLRELYERPGFLLRRAHQIATALFLDSSGALGITTSQYGVLFVLNVFPNLDQIGLAMLMGLDRSTVGLVVGKLEKDGLIERQVDHADRRRKILMLTKAGKRMLERLALPAQRAQSRLLSPFSEEEEQQFLALVSKLVQYFNATIRAPIMPMPTRLGARQSLKRGPNRRSSSGLR